MRKVKGFCHVLMTNHWYSIILDQIRIILTSGLYDECEEISIGCLGTAEQKRLLQKFICDVYPKFNIKYHSEDIGEFEFPTIRLIERDIDEYVGFYFHTKAVTRLDDVAQTNVRAWMNENILNRWREHRKRVEDGWDISSVNIMFNPDHYSGNFWWFNRGYIDSLPKVDDLDKQHRWKAEQWICMCKNKKAYSDCFLEATNTPFRIKYKL